MNLTLTLNPYWLIPLAYFVIAFITGLIIQLTSKDFWDWDDIVPDRFLVVIMCIYWPFTLLLYGLEFVFFTVPRYLTGRHK